MSDEEKKPVDAPDTTDTTDTPEAKEAVDKIAEAAPPARPSSISKTGLLAGVKKADETILRLNK